MMKKVEDDLPDFLSKIQSGRPSAEHFDSEILDKIVSNDNFMDKLREASKMAFGHLEDEDEVDEVVITDNKQNSHPPIILVKNNDFLEKMKKLADKLTVNPSAPPATSQTNFGDFFPSKNVDSGDLRFSPISDPDKEIFRQKLPSAVFPQSLLQKEPDDEIIFITERPRNLADENEDRVRPSALGEKTGGKENVFRFPPAVPQLQTLLVPPGGKHVVSTHLVVQVRANLLIVFNI